MMNNIEWDKDLCTWGTVQHQTKAFYFVALKFAGLPDHHILTDYGDILGYEHVAIVKDGFLFHFTISTIKST
jgi:hypothetical protein